MTDISAVIPTVFSILKKLLKTVSKKEFPGSNRVHLTPSEYVNPSIPSLKIIQLPSIEIENH